jgi:hypothetical protein
MRLNSLEIAAILALSLAAAVVARPQTLRAEWIYNTDQDQKSSKQLSNKNSSSVVINPPPVVDSSAPAQPIPNIPLILAPPFMPGAQRAPGMSTLPSQGGTLPAR